ncbi:MAG: hypothetical protein KDA62_22300, partial [Planctomycetales bacterium]|nr:hypothetical protein [Planctomycetales bacterium]
MPFKVCCPYPDCGKFMLVEDSDRGGSVNCLICRRSIRLDGADGGASPGAATSSSAGASVA